MPEALLSLNTRRHDLRNGVPEIAGRRPITRARALQVARSQRLPQLDSSPRFFCFHRRSPRTPAASCRDKLRDIAFSPTCRSGLPSRCGVSEHVPNSVQRSQSPDARSARPQDRRAAPVDAARSRDLARGARRADRGASALISSGAALSAREIASAAAARPKAPRILRRAFAQRVRSRRLRFALPAFAVSAEAPSAGFAGIHSQRKPLSPAAQG